MSILVKRRTRVGIIGLLAVCLVFVGSTWASASSAQDVAGTSRSAAAATSTKKTVPWAGGNCTKTLTTSGGKAKLRTNGWAFVDFGTRSAELDRSRGYAEVYSCTHDARVVASRIQVKQVWRVTFTGVQSCEGTISLTPSLTCSVSGHTITLTAQKTCKNKSSCTFNNADDIVVSPTASQTITGIRYSLQSKARQGKKKWVRKTTKEVKWGI